MHTWNLEQTDAKICKKNVDTGETRVHSDRCIHCHHVDHGLGLAG
jgi:hypothetical protein